MYDIVSNVYGIVQQSVGFCAGKVYGHVHQSDYLCASAGKSVWNCADQAVTRMDTHSWPIMLGKVYGFVLAIVYEIVLSISAHIARQANTGAVCAEIAPFPA